MPSRNNLHVPDELLAELRLRAAAEGKTVEAVVEEALRMRLNDRGWQDLLDYGRKTGVASGYAEEDVPQLVKTWRREQRAQ